VKGYRDEFDDDETNRPARRARLRTCPARRGLRQKPERTRQPTAGRRRRFGTPGSAQDFVVNVGDRVFFLVDQSTLNPEARVTLDRQAQWLALYPRYTVTVEGHADERGTREYNIALGARRAKSAHDYLVARGVNPQRLRTISYGKERPVAICSEDSCFAQNRRAVTVINNAGS
jgi:peptidoglycan-associated lipoprotein